MNEVGVEKPKSPESLRASAETVRCIIKKGDRVLLLQKSKNSMVPDMYEFPGGNIENDDHLSTLEEQVETVQKEISEETLIDISGLNPLKVDMFDYEFQGKKDTIKRRVHLFLLEIPDLDINTVKTGTHENDFHNQAVWVTIGELKKMKDEGKLLGNSTRFESAFSS